MRKPAPAPVAKAPAEQPAKEVAREAPVPKRGTTTSRTAPPRTAAPRTAAPRTTTRYTVQVAAYDTRTDAAALVKKLADRGIKARVSGTSKPFRVRLALHSTRKDANVELSAMRKRGIEGFVAEEEVTTGARTP